MNKERILALADYLETKVPPSGFNMGQWLSRRGECGTVACVAGWCVVANGLDMKLSFLPVFDEARDWLELDQAMAYKLFLPQGIPNAEASKEAAIAVLRELAETGSVNWPYDPDWDVIDPDRDWEDYEP